MDVLSEILTTLELSSQLYFRAELGAPFAVAVPEERAAIRFHVVAEGSCTIGTSAGPAAACGAGDLVLVPHGAPHVISVGDAETARPLAAVLAESGFDGVGPLVCGGRGAKSVLVCGHFAFGRGALHPIVSSLPSLLHVRADEAGGYAWMEAVLRHVEAEARGGRAGHREVARRLSEILLIEVLRAASEKGELVALSALADPQLGRALEALHAEPERSWSLDDLARIAGLSRTLFTERFRERMGASPMKYLASWRVQKARSLLARTRCSVAEAARQVGYESESAFHRAFRAQFGVSPGSYRVL